MLEPFRGTETVIKRESLFSCGDMEGAHQIEVCSLMQSNYYLQVNFSQGEYGGDLWRHSRRNPWRNSRGNPWRNSRANS